jgi:CHAT domain-containing protein
MSYTGDTTEDGFLYAYEISQLNLNAQMVVLNGCNTGYGVLRKSEGLISIARSFFYTGVKTVAYSLWPVADNSGSVLVSGFYKELKKNEPLDDALRDTKLSFIESTDPVKAHPYYWANFMIAGNTDPVRLYKYPVWLKVLVLVFVGGVFYGIYYRFRANS